MLKPMHKGVSEETLNVLRNPRPTKSWTQLAKEHPEIPALKALALSEVTDSKPDSTEVRLSTTGQQVKKHFLEYRPKEAAQLEKEGLLDQECEMWATLAEEAFLSRVTQGGDANLAREVENRYLYLPDEQSVPNLSLYDPLH